MKIIHALASLALAATLLAAPEPDEVFLWPNGAPGSEGKPRQPQIERGQNGERRITAIHHPSITPYLPPADQAIGTAVLVMPGGGHRMLAYDHEGHNVGAWLAERGYAAFVLKYRLARETNSTYQLPLHPVADARQALQIIRARAAEWKVDPARVGVLGFSAGGELAAMVSGNFDFGDAAAQNAADSLVPPVARPAFQALIYPGSSQKISPAKDSPPAFLACAFDDRPDFSAGLAELFLRFKKAGVRTELHIYSTGGHGFGLRAKSTRPAGAWAERFVEWLAESGVGAKPGT